MQDYLGKEYTIIDIQNDSLHLNSILKQKGRKSSRICLEIIYVEVSGIDQLKKDRMSRANKP